MSKNVVCWFEIYVDDMERAKKFYGEVLKTTFQDAEMPGDAGEDSSKMAFFDCEDMETSVSGALVYMPELRSGNDCQSTGTVVYFPCEDCSVEEGLVVAAGGKVLTPKMSLGEFGFCSICSDSEGNTFGLHSQQ